MTQLIHKRGDSFSFIWLLDNIQPDGSSANFDASDWTARCQIRRNGILVDEIDVVWIGRNPAMFSTVKNDTQSWLPGVHELDVEFITFAGQKISSPTIEVIVLEDKTK